MNKKRILITLGCIIVLLFVIGISYAYWSLTFTQTENNVVMTDCFEIEFMEGNAINLSKAYPVSDSDGTKNTPYTFTIKNICDSSAKYQINLESLEVSGKKLPEQYLKANLKEENIKKITTKLDKELNPKLNTETTIEGAISAYKLYEGILNPNETKEYSLRLWMHSDVTASDKESMNANYSGKISIITSYYQDNREDNRGTLMAVNLDEEYGYTSGAFWDYKENIAKVVFENELRVHEDAEHIFDVSETQDGSVMSYLVKQDLTSNYILYIQGNGGVYANSNSMALFLRFSKLENIEGLEYFDTSSATNMRYMFYGCSSFNNIDLSSFDTSNVTDMSLMFYICSSLTNLDVSSFDTSSVTDMHAMFYECSSLNHLDVSNFDTSKVSNMESMFSVCSSLNHLDVSNFDTSKVSNMESMFSVCSSLVNLDLSSFDTSSATNMRYMFYECSSLNHLDVSNFDTSKVSNMESMFSVCSSLVNLDLSSFDTSNVKYMDSMFSDCSSLTNIEYGENFVHKEGANTYNLFNNCPANHPTHESWNGVQF